MYLKGLILKNLLNFSDINCLLEVKKDRSLQPVFSRNACLENVAYIDFVNIKIEFAFLIFDACIGAGINQ